LGADLGDDDRDLARRNLRNRPPLHRVHEPELEADTAAQQLGLVAGLAVEAHDIAAVELLGAETLAHQPHLGRPDLPERHVENEGDEPDDRDHQPADDKIPEPRGRCDKGIHGTRPSFMLSTAPEHTTMRLC
jgi:hypothetical protein